MSPDKPHGVSTAYCVGEVSVLVLALALALALVVMMVVLLLLLLILLLLFSGARLDASVARRLHGWASSDISRSAPDSSRGTAFCSLQRRQFAPGRRA